MGSQGPGKGWSKTPVKEVDIGAALKAEASRIVARFTKGKAHKGSTFARPQKTHLTPKREKDKRGTPEIRVDLLKAIFFVKPLEGDPGYEENKRFDELKDPENNVPSDVKEPFSPSSGNKPRLVHCSLSGVFFGFCIQR
jgi:hypothetical protein